MVGRVFIEGLKIHAYHGVLPQERVVGNDYVISLSAEYPMGDALVSDDVNDTLNYAVVAQIVTEQMGQPSNLVEHVAGRIAAALRKQFPAVKTIQIKITKIAPPMSVDCVGAGVDLIF